ncbi:MAG: L-glyceraldehyde 3-phosphate reductase [Geminicoccaceae bacterium]|jgi:L-glyceraldehyde 3-phosphate reductase|nr:L-glyceraldehyde 3-phosphate reductase [Geminicoccaceae bacterium]
MSWHPAERRYDGMVYNRCGRSGLKLPAISLGLWHNFGSSSAVEDARAMIRRAFDLGITHFNLANNYGPPPGAAEETFGRVLATDLEAHRDELVVSTKAGYDMWPGPYGDGGSRKYLLASLDQSLSRMGLDYVDIFYSHRPDPETPLEETMGALDPAVRSGKALDQLPQQPAGSAGRRPSAAGGRRSAARSSDRRRALRRRSARYLSQARRPGAGSA